MTPEGAEVGEGPRLSVERGDVRGCRLERALNTGDILHGLTLAALACSDCRAPAACCPRTAASSDCCRSTTFFNASTTSSNQGLTLVPTSAQLRCCIRETTGRVPHEQTVRMKPGHFAHLEARRATGMKPLAARS
jgi:hypothetical protein